MNTLHILIGINGSGKTTYGTTLAKEVNGVLISIDDFVEEFRKSNMSRKEMWDNIYKKFWDNISKEILTKDVVVDACCVNTNGWKFLINLCPSSTKVIGYWFDIPPFIASKREKLRDKKTPYDMLKSRWESMLESKQHLKEFFKEVVYIKPNPLDFK